MKVILDTDRVALLHGDCKAIGDFLDENSVDSLVTDPPAGIDFMGKGWDGDKGGRDSWIAWLRDSLSPSFKALKPGGYAFIWALPRTSHWTATAIEDAGFEIRDVHHHIFGTGFPKSLTSKSASIPNGTGSALKPAVEHWILARKPLEGTYAENFAKYGTGVLNIDVCRIAGRERTEYGLKNSKRSQGVAYNTPTSDANFNATLGRWPAHLSMDEDGAAALDDRANKDAGGASRFFYIAKGSRSEKDVGLEHLTPRTAGESTDRKEGSAGLKSPRAGAGRTSGARNFHPTVKSVTLMRWLVKLITPPGGTVLDQFAGSGTTGVAALMEGFNFIGVEQGGENDEYLPILVGRIKHALEQYSSV